MQKTTNLEIVAEFAAPVGKNKFKNLSINLGHTGNGYNYFTGKQYSAGHRLSFTPCTITPFGRQSILMSGDQWESGFYVPLDDAPRKNPNYLKRAKTYLEGAGLVADIARAFADHDIAVIRKIAGEVHTAAFKAPSKAKPAKVASLPSKNLMPQNVLDMFARVGEQQERKDPIVIAKFFNAAGAGTWYATEYKDGIFFGYVSLFGDHCDEWGSFALSDLENVPTIERDRYFIPCAFSELKLTHN